MAATITSTRSSNALIAAASLALAPLEISPLYSASIESPPATSLNGSTFYSADEIKRGSSLTQFLRGWEGYLPNRGAILGRLREDGALQALHLHPVEERIFSLWKEQPARELDISIALAQASLRNGTVSDDRVFGRFKNLSNSLPVQSTPSTSSVSVDDYEKGLRFCYHVIGSKLLDTEGPLTSSAKQYVDLQTQERAAAIIQILGALEVWKTLEKSSPAYAPTKGFLKNANSFVTRTDIAAIAPLGELPGVVGGTALAGGLLSTVGVGIWALYRLYQGRASLNPPITEKP
jgi:hypothetical protein